MCLNNPAGNTGVVLCYFHNYVLIFVKSLQSQSQNDIQSEIEIVPTQDFNIIMDADVLDPPASPVQNEETVIGNFFQTSFYCIYIFINNQFILTVCTTHNNMYKLSVNTRTIEYTYMHIQLL